MGKTRQHTLLKLIQIFNRQNANDLLGFRAKASVLHVLETLGAHPRAETEHATDHGASTTPD